MANKSRDTANLVSAKTGIAVTLSGDPVILGVGNTEHVRLTGGGLVGIGTDNPDTSLHIHSNTATSFDAIRMTGRVKRKNVIKVNNSDNLIVSVDEDNEGDDSNFRLQIDGSEKVRITSAGFVGIGTDIPEEDLHIEADNPTIKLLDTTPGGDDDYVVVSHLNGTTSIDSYYNGAGGVTRFRQASTEYARLDTNGNIGIGTDNPSQQVHLGKYGDHARIRIESSGTGNRSGIEFYRETSAGMNKGGAGIWVESDTSSSDGVLNFGTASNAGLHSQQSKMILDVNGRLGIGTDTNHTVSLTLADGSSSGIFMGNVGVYGYRIRSNISNTANYGIMIEDQDGVDLWRITGPDGTSSSTRNTHQLYINGTEHLRLDSSGRLCVESVTGTASAARFGTLDGSSFENLENTINVYGHSASDYTLIRGCNTADGTPVFDAQVSGTRRIEIEANGDVHNSTGVYSQISDSQFKENIVDSPSQWEDVKALRVRKFNFTEASGYQTHTQIGYVAQEIEQVSPGLVKTRYLYNEEGEEISESEYKTVKVSLINVKAVKALQEAMARIEILESRLNSAGIATT